MIHGCLCLPCPQPEPIRWDGRTGDGTTWDGGRVEGCYVHCSDAGLLETNCCEPAGDGLLQCRYACAGRAPAGLATLSSIHGTVGSWLAVSAELEAAAVHAFWELADELEAHGIPGDAARRAADDEVRHARDTTRLALRHGHMPAAPRVRPLAEPRSLEAIALDNAVEGCGRELFGAVLNAWQAEHAADPEVRALMANIAPDELAHARFSRELNELLRPRVSRGVRQHLREAQEEALLAFAAAENHPQLREPLGLFDAGQAVAVARRLLDARL